MIEDIHKLANIIGEDIRKRDELISYIEDKAHEKLLVYSSLDREKLDEMIEDGRYEEAIDKLQSVIEELEGGYCVILDKIEGKI